MYLCIFLAVYVFYFPTFLLDVFRSFTVILLCRAKVKKKNVASVLGSVCVADELDRHVLIFHDGLGTLAQAGGRAGRQLTLGCSGALNLICQVG